MRISTFAVLTLALGLGACTRAPSTGGHDRTSPSVAAAGGGAGGVAPQATSPVSGPLAVRPAPASSGPAHAAASADEHTIGLGQVFANLVVYPVTSRSQVDVGPLITLDDALAKGVAEVREVEGGGSVNTLVIDNKGTVPIFVLAGTIVKGGNQDRQIGQDFIIEGKQKSPVDAFCVEHGRWNGQRNGQATAGRFGASDVLATSKIRAAGQYKKSQGEVWSKVSEANSANKQRPASDTFLASVDDATLAKQRSELGAKIEASLASVNPQQELVGIAFAIDGDVKGVRWFAHHDVFQMVRKKLVAGIALDAITAKAEAEAQGRAASTKPAPSPAAVDQFVKNVEAAAVTERRDTAAGNVNEYSESAAAYGSKTMLKGASSKPGASPKKPVSSDFLSK
ncbi:MAG: hypothetical protein KF819_23335 [Labilithrix sp.]|nr:hypothetical protein [Labilithrix sp.]